jgi:putative transposase
MSNYRRNFIAGGSFFFTVNLNDRRSSLLVEKIDLLRQAFRNVKNKLPYDIAAMVVLPDHLHCIWTLPPDDSDYPIRWKMIKALFSRGLPKIEIRSQGRQSKGERGIWQRRYWEHTLRDENDWQRHVDYIHYNPVKHGHIARVAEWPFSTFHRYVKNGIYQIEWGSDPEDLDGNFGE